MSSWPPAKARRVFAALKRIGWRHDRTVGSHKIMKKDGWADYPFSFHDSEELGPAILAKISKKTGLQPPDLRCRRPCAIWESDCSDHDQLTAYRWPYKRQSRVPPRADHGFVRKSLRLLRSFTLRLNTSGCCAAGQTTQTMVYRTENLCGDRRILGSPIHSETRTVDRVRIARAEMLQHHQRLRATPIDEGHAALRRGGRDK